MKNMSEPTRRSLRPYMLAVFRFTLGLVFVYASIGKILDPKAFAENLLDYHIFSSATLVRYLAVTLPWTEWICGIFLILGTFVRSVSILTTCMLVIFVGAMISALMRGLEIHCGCFGSTHEIIGAFALLRDGLLLCISLAIMISKIDPLALQSFIANRKHQP
jgi:uncharacterized membrane protein YphA (DoxX/SURF4 family)